MLPTTRARARQGTRTSAFTRGIAALLAVGLTTGLVTLAASPASASAVTTTYTGPSFYVLSVGGTNTGQSSVVVPTGTGTLRSLTLNLLGQPQPAPLGLAIAVRSPSGAMIDCGTGGTCLIPPSLLGADPAGTWTLFGRTVYDPSNDQGSDQEYSYDGFTLGLTTEVADLAITANPSNASVQSGTAVTFASAATGNPTPAAQWQVDAGSGFVDVPGAISPSYAFTPKAADSGKTYRVRYSSTQGTVHSTIATLTVGALAPSITLEPQSVTAASGSRVVLESDGTGDPTPTIQWYRAAPGSVSFAAVPGATSKNLTLDSVTFAESGAQYLAAYSNDPPDVTTTNTVTLTVTPQGPVLTSGPRDVTVNEGRPASFSAAASGDPVATVQWQISTDGGATFTNIAGANDATYTIASATRAQHLGQYRAVFRNIAGPAVTTAVATLQVQYGPDGFAHPSGVDIASGGTATFTASAVGNPTPTVQWQISTDGTVFSDILGETSTTLTLDDRRFADSGSHYRATFTNAVTSRTTDSARLTVRATSPDVTVAPIDQRVPAGTQVTFTSAATGDPSPTVQWWRSIGGGPFLAIAGATADSYTFTATAQDNGNRYRADYQNTMGSYYWGQIAYLTVGVAPVVTVHPADQTVVAGTRATFTSTVTSQPNSSVQWQVSTDGATFADITGATFSTLELDGLTYADSGTRYQAVHTNWVGSVTTNPATLTVTAAVPVVTTDVSDQEVLAGSPVTFTAAATGDPTPTVQWWFSTDGGQTYVAIAGATSDTHTFIPTAGDDGTWYRAEFRNVGGGDHTSAAVLTVNVAPVVTLDPTDQTATEDTRATFTTGATGQPSPTVQWQVSVDGRLTFTDLTGATAPTLSVLADERATGNRYRAVHTNAGGHATTQEATLTVLPLADIVTQPTGQAVGVGARARFSARSDDPTATIQWQVSTDGGRTFTDLAGQVGGELSFLTTPDQDGNLYRAAFTTLGGVTTTDPVALTLTAAPVAPAAPAAPITPTAPGGALPVTGADSALLALVASLLLAAGTAAVVIRRGRHATA